VSAVPVWLLALVVAAAALLAGRWALQARRRRLFRDTLTGAAGDTPAFRVTVLDAPAGHVRVRLNLYGTGEGLDLVRLTAPTAAAGAASLRAPPGFDLDPAGSAEEPEVSRWRPAAGVRAAPGGTLELEWTYDPAACAKPIPVQGWAERGVGRDRTGAGFVVLVGPREAREVEAANLRSALFAEARERGVAPRTLPAWPRLEELERGPTPRGTERTRGP
jgi:hypothetical protein